MNKSKKKKNGKKLNQIGIFFLVFVSVKVYGI